jgi:hypothetical protein
VRSPRVDQRYAEIVGLAREFGRKQAPAVDHHSRIFDHVEQERTSPG